MIGYWPSSLLFHSKWVGFEEKNLGVFLERGEGVGDLRFGGFGMNEYGFKFVVNCF